MDDSRPRVPIAVAMPVLHRRTLTPAEGGPVAYQVPGIEFEHGLSMYQHAFASVARQTVDPAGSIHVALDDGRAERHGAGATRGRALRQALEHLHSLYREDPWVDHPYGTFVSFVDDDDLLYPPHLETHYRLLTEGDGADVAYSWFDGNDPFAAHRGRRWDPQEPHHTTMTITVRSSFAQQAVDEFDGPEMHEDWSGEDWRFILKLNELGARFVGTGDVTWHYRCHQGNTSGLPSKGDALT